MSIPARIAATGTILINALSFLLSFTALTDIARRAHVTVPIAWPLIVDGLIVVATVAVVALRGSLYAWFLLGSGALVSIAGNVLHALYPEGPIPVPVAAFLAVVPPVALVAVTHLTVHLTRHSSPEPSSPASPAHPRAAAEQLIRQAVLSNYAIADRVGVSEATIRRWRKSVGASGVSCINAE